MPFDPVFNFRAGGSDSASTEETIDNSFLKEADLRNDAVLNTGFYSVLDGGAIGDAFDFAGDVNKQAIELSSESIDAVMRTSGEAFDLVGGVSGEAFDLVGGASGEAFDLVGGISGEAFVAYKDVNKNANDVIQSSLSVLSNVVNGAFSFTSQAQKDATESIQKTTSEQTSMYAQSLDAVQRSVSTSLTQGNTDIIRLVMMGLVGFGLVFALIK
jgi:hypothetical protein